MSDLDVDMDELETDDDVPKRSKLKFIILAVVGLLIVAGGAYFVTGMFGSSEDDALVDGEAIEDASEDIGPIDDEDLVYLSIDRLPAPLMGANGRVQGYVFLDFSLEMHSGFDQSFVSERMPRVKDAFIRAISANGVGRANAPGVIDFDRVTDYLRDAANEVLGAEVVKRVLIVRDLRTPT